MKLKTSLFALFMGFLLISTAQTTIHIPGDQPTIQAGIDVATDGDTVLVDPGIYFENINFNGKGITVASHYIINEDTNYINNTVINGSNPANPDSGSVVTFDSGTDTTSVIYGFTITGGTGTSIYSDTWRLGGGIMCYLAGAKIIHNKIINNTSNHINNAYGGGIGIISSSRGIGINPSGTWVVICSNTIQDNVSSSDNIARGGGIYSKGNCLLIKGNIIRHDSLFGDAARGGGVYATNTPYLEMTGNMITQNSVYSITSYWGAGVICFSSVGPVKISLNEFSYNIGDTLGYGGGGGLHIENTFDYPVEIDRNRFLYNTAQYGGGLHEVSCYNMRVTNNIFIGNNGSRAGAMGIYNMYQSSGEYQSQFINNTFYNNSAGNGYGGAITYWADFPSSPVFINCIFWENAGPSFWEEITNLSNDTVIVFNSDIDIESIWGPWYGKSNFYADPEFDTDSIHLLKSSPCINKGIDTLEISGTFYYCPDHDIDGDPRPLLDSVDVGADEYDIQPGIYSLDNTSDDSSIEIFPNPFIETTSIKFNLQSAGQVELNLFDISGREVRALINNNLQTGFHEVKLNSSGLKSGIYFCVLKTEQGTQSKKLINLD